MTDDVDADARQRDVTAINKLIADHAEAGLRYTQTNPEQTGLNAVFGDEKWALAQWHARRAELLTALRDADPARAATWVRELAVAELARDGDGQ